LADLTASLNLSVENSGNTPTYSRINSQSVIDVTFSRLPATATIRGWKVLDGVKSFSDHRYVEFELQKSNEQEDDAAPHARGWSFRSLDLNKLLTHVSKAPQPVMDLETTADRAAEILVGYLGDACNVCMSSRAAPPNGKISVNWWNNDIARLRPERNGLRRACQRSSHLHDSPQQIHSHRAVYVTIRYALKTTICDYQLKCSVELCRAVDADPCGLPYKVVTKKIGRRRPGVESRGKEEEIADYLFPNPKAIDWSRGPPLDDDESGTPDLTPDEMAAPCRRLPPGKATGPDGIPNEVLLLAHGSGPKYG